MEILEFVRQGAELLTSADATEKTRVDVAMEMNGEVLIMSMRKATAEETDEIKNINVTQIGSTIARHRAND